LVGKIKITSSFGGIKINFKIIQKKRGHKALFFYFYKVVN
jgi:hypothetical protein